MNNIIKERNSNEIITQLKRAELQKSILIKNIYKEYENYFNIVRNSIISYSEKGIFGLYSELSTSEKDPNKIELIKILNKNISLLIHSKLPLITIEQLKLEDIIDFKKNLVNVNDLKELVEFEESQPVDLDYENELITKESQPVDFDYENELITKESLEFHCNYDSNSYGYYESLSKDKLSSLNLDESYYFNSFSNQNTLKNNKNKKIFEPPLDLIEDTKNNLNHHEKLNQKFNDVFITSDNLNFFEIIDKAFINFLLKISYEINSELFKINMIKKFISEYTFKCLSNNNYIINHPQPFVISYDLNVNKHYAESNKNLRIYLLNISNVELEFYNLDLSICRNNINQLKSRFRLLNKKHRYWINKKLNLNNLY